MTLFDIIFITGDIGLVTKFDIRHLCKIWLSKSVSHPNNFKTTNLNQLLSADKNEISFRLKYIYCITWKF